MAKYEMDGVLKAIALLRELAEAERELGVSELSRSLGIGKTTIFRLLHTLSVEGLVKQDPETKRYRLGADLAVLGRAASESFDLRREARPIMERLAAHCGMPIFLNVPGRSQVVCIEHIASHANIDLYGKAGHTMPYHACPSGYVLLAFGPPQLLEQTLQQGLDRYASQTIVQPDLLRERLAEVAGDGLAYGEDDLEEGVASLSAPIYDHRDVVVAALGIAGFSVPFAGRREELAVQLLEAAQDISTLSGGARPDRFASLSTDPGGPR
jgi:DNA-binding IclR family transcriptional regulator